MAMKPAGYVPLESAKNLIISALGDFDPALGVRAADILYDKQRANIVEVDESKTHMMMCRPAGITNDDVAAAGMKIPDFAENFGPHFTRQDNPTEKSIVDFEYDGSYASVVWLAHEVGHAIADDVQHENGHSFKNFSADEMEEQAYFVQRIVSQRVRDQVSISSGEDFGENLASMSTDRARQFNHASTAFKAADTGPSEDRKATIVKALDQRLAL